jgi:hypothetical protein
MSRVRFVCFATVLIVGLHAIAVMAQRPAVTFPVIVVFNDDAP